MLLRLIEENTTKYDVPAIAAILVDGGADLGDEISCIDILSEAGVRPWQFDGSLLDARIAAHNIRASRYWILKAVSTGAAAVLIAIAFFGTSSEAYAAAPLPQPHDEHAASVVAAGILVLAAAIIMLFRGDKSFDD